MPVNFRRDQVNWCDGVPPEPNQAEDLESFLLERIELKYDARRSRRSTRSFWPLLQLSLPRDCCNRADSTISSLMKHISPLRTYFSPEMIPWRALLIACTCWDIGEPRLAVGGRPGGGRYSGPPNLGGRSIDHPGAQVHLTDSNTAPSRLLLRGSPSFSLWATPLIVQTDRAQYQRMQTTGRHCGRSVDTHLR